MTRVYVNVYPGLRVFCENNVVRVTFDKTFKVLRFSYFLFIHPFIFSFNHLFIYFYYHILNEIQQFWRS